MEDNWMSMTDKEQYIYNLVDGDKNPATFRYLKMYGVDSGISMWELPPTYSSTEAFYKKCLDLGVSAKELKLKFPPDAIL